MNKYFLLAVAFTNLSVSAAAAKKEVKPKKSKKEYSYRDERYTHTPVPSRPGLDPQIASQLKAVIYNDFPEPILFSIFPGTTSKSPGPAIEIKPYQQAKLPVVEQWKPGPLFLFQFKRDTPEKNATDHVAAIGQWLYPDIGDYGIIIKKDESLVTDLDIDVVPIKELGALEERSAKELFYPKVKPLVQEAGTALPNPASLPSGVCEIVAGYAGTDVEGVELPKANEE